MMSSLVCLIYQPFMELTGGRITDIRTIIDDDVRLQRGIAGALEQYNLDQFVTVDAPDDNHQVIVSESGRVGDPRENRFIDPRSKKTFIFDHLRLEIVETLGEEPGASSEPFREALDKATQAYIAEHFHEGVGSVFAVEPDKFVIQIVANKYNPSNFWSGRWRSKYEVDVKNRVVTGSIQINVHYYEQGNVQLSTSFTPKVTLPPSAPDSAAAKQLLAQISEQEGKYQTALSDTYQDLGEKSFKPLRRALPMTRNKLDWEKVTGYKLGAELQTSRGAFTLQE